MRADERDVIFSRMSYTPGSPEYLDYYGRRPELKESDDKLRISPGLGSPQTPTYDPAVSPVMRGVFNLLADLHPLTCGQVGNEKMSGDQASYTSWAKGLALEAGASGVGSLALTSDHYYSHRGRLSEHYGRPIDDFLPYGLVVAVPMNPKLLRQAPNAAEMTATVMGYLEGAKVALALAYAIRQAGFRARAHIDGHYLFPLRRLARETGLGAIGRNGLIITKNYGPGIRLAGVDTDMPLTQDSPDPDEAKIVDFCLSCGLCARQCPAISKSEYPGTGPREDICYKTWRKLGTDCGRCIGCCPLTGQATDWNKL